MFVQQRKLSIHKNFRHGQQDMRRRRIVRRESQISVLGGAGLAALAGFAMGVVLMHKSGGMNTLLGRLMPPGARGKAARGRGAFSDSFYDLEGIAHDVGDYEGAEDEIEPDEAEAGVASELEERVLDAFVNDPVLTNSAVEISAESDGVVTLHGWVAEKAEAEHAALIAGGVPGVVGVANSIRVRLPRAARSSQ